MKFSFEGLLVVVT